MSQNKSIERDYKEAGKSIETMVEKELTEIKKKADEIKKEAERIGKKIEGSLDLADFLLDEARIAAVPGIAFGADEFIRFSFAAALGMI